ncbi:MAG: DUF2288 domain-containing protein [Nitrosomonadales bacterium]|nr:DUF2288 domain-containing protein [Nitrosomonadales bacterium]
MSNSDQREIYRAKINLETSKIAWKELQRFFAGGKALMVSADLDLVEAAFQISEDNVAQIRQWMATGQLTRVPDEQARQWVEADALVWAVVVSPWVLVQSADKLH